MAGRQGHNAHKGKQGFQRSNIAPQQPWFFNVPPLPGEPDPSARIKSTPGEGAQVGALMLLPTTAITVGIFTAYIPMGGSLAIAGAAVALNFIAYAYSAYEIIKYFLWRRKFKAQNDNG